MYLEITINIIVIFLNLYIFISRTSHHIYSGNGLAEHLIASAQIHYSTVSVRT